MWRCFGFIIKQVSRVTIDVTSKERAGKDVDRWLEGHARGPYLSRAGWFGTENMIRLNKLRSPPPT